MATSGTVSQTRFGVRKIIELAFGQCKKAPEEITAYNVEVAQDLLFARLSALANDSIPLWLIRRDVLPLYSGEFEVECPQGVVDVLNCNLRSTQRLDGSPSASEGDATRAFDGDLSTACVQTTPDGWIQLDLQTFFYVTTYGVLPASSGTWSWELQGSEDGLTYETLDAVSARDV